MDNSTSLKTLLQSHPAAESLLIRDVAGKEILSEPYITGWVLKCCAKEFANVPIEDIVEKYIPKSSDEIRTTAETYKWEDRLDYISDTIEITPEPDDTAETEEETVNIEEYLPDNFLSPDYAPNTPCESLIYNLVRSDIRFNAADPVTRKPICVNMEVQNANIPGFSPIRQAMYYGAKALREPGSTESPSPDAGGAKKGYTIWFCLNTPQNIPGSIVHYSMSASPDFGNMPADPEDSNIQETVMVYFNAEDPAAENSKLPALLRLLFAPQASASGQQERLTAEFGIPSAEGQKLIEMSRKFTADITENGSV